MSSVPPSLSLACTLCSERISLDDSGRDVPRRRSHGVDGPDPNEEGRPPRTEPLAPPVLPRPIHGRRLHADAWLHGGIHDRTEGPTSPSHGSLASSGIHRCRHPIRDGPARENAPAPRPGNVVDTRRRRHLQPGDNVIVCPRCGNVLVEGEERFSCHACQYRAEKEAGIALFNPEILEDHGDYKAEGLDAVYSQERRHPWFRHRVSVIRKAFLAHVAKTEDILEVGAGTGHTARALLADGYQNFSVGEIHKNGVLYRKQYGLEKLYQIDLRSSPFRDHFDVVALVDVLQHLGDDAPGVRDIHDMPPA